MTNEPTTTDHSAAGHSCAHCNADDDHHALDEKGIVDSFRATLSTAGTVRVLMALALIASAALWAPLGILAGVLAWAVATAGGLVAVSLTNRRYGTANAVIIGTVVSAAVLPVMAWVTTLVLGGELAIALAGASGWFLATAVVETLRDRRLLALLIADSRDGEAARHGVLFGKPLSPWVGLAWAGVTAALFGAWVWVIDLLPWALLPLIPLQVVLALFSRRGGK